MWYSDIDTHRSLTGENWDSAVYLGNPLGKSYSWQDLADWKAQHTTGSYVDVTFRVTNTDGSGPATAYLHFDARSDKEGHPGQYEWSPGSHDITGIINIVPAYLLGSLGAFIVPGLVVLRKRK